VVHNGFVAVNLDPIGIEEFATARAIQLWRSEENEFQPIHAAIDYSTPKHAIWALAQEQQERFLELIGFFPPVVQDVFIQYLIMGRNQAQISETLGIVQGSETWKALRLGTQAICAILAWGSDSSKMNGHAYAASYRWIQKWKTRTTSTRILRLKLPVNLGKFEVSGEDRDLAEFFSSEMQYRFYTPRC
jgi:hypothetical protein